MPKGHYRRTPRTKRDGAPPELRKALIVSLMSYDMPRYGDAAAALREWLKVNPRKADEDRYQREHATLPTLSRIGS
jgi:hypothetical protein